MGQTGRHAGGAGGDQFYVTHCTVTDSVLNNPGYTVRASSTTEPAALDAAFHYPPYELPIDMWRDLPPPALAPRRLARTKHPKGGVWAVHSAYLAKDTVDRDRSYFSHLLLLPDADTAAVLRSWGAREWATSYPSGAPKVLPRSAPLPVGELVGDAALTAFLGDDPVGPTELSVTVCPERLRASTSNRRELFTRFLRALLLLAEEENDARRRLYVHAEPGLVALILYGAVRLLPPAVIDDLTFSTFEPHHRNVRDYKLAEVVGTVLGAPDRGLDPDLGTTRGIALDTFVANRSSPELRVPGSAAPEGVNELVDLAATGDWDLLPGVKHAVGPDPSGLHKAGAALARARGLARVGAGTATIDDLLALQLDPVAAEELKSRTGKLWRVVKAAALTRRDVRSAFQHLIAQPDHTRELWEEAVEAVLKEDFPQWDARWGLIRAAAGADEARRMLSKLVSSEKNENRLSALPVAIRNKLRFACADVNLFPSRPLLVPVVPGELDPLLRAPPEWAGYTAFTVMAEDKWDWLTHIPPSGRAPMRAAARAYLQAALPTATAAYVRAARPFFDTDPALLTALFVPYSEGAARLMDGLLGSQELEPGDWMKLCETIGLLQNEWGEFLLEKERLANLLIGLGGAGAGRDVWGGYLGLLTPALISTDLIEVTGDDDPVTIHEWERKVHAHLRTAAARLTAADAKLVHALPPGAVARLFAATALVKWVDNPATIPHGSPDEVPHACRAFEVDPCDLVRAAYKKGGFDLLSLPEDAAKLAPLVDLFRACFPVDETFTTARRAATEAIRFTAVCPARLRGALQAYFILASVPDFHHSALLEDATRQHELDPFAVARIRERIAKPAKKASTKYVPPAPVREDVPSEEESVPEEEAEPLIKKRKKAKQSGCLGIVLFVLALVACALVARIT